MPPQQNIKEVDFSFLLHFFRLLHRSLPSCIAPLTDSICETFTAPLWPWWGPLVVRCGEDGWAGEVKREEPLDAGRSDPTRSRFDVVRVGGCDEGTEHPPPQRLHPHCYTQLFLGSERPPPPPPPQGLHGAPPPPFGLDDVHTRPSVCPAMPPPPTHPVKLAQLLGDFSSVSFSCCVIAHFSALFLCLPPVSPLLFPSFLTPSVWRKHPRTHMIRPRPGQM